METGRKKMKIKSLSFDGEHWTDVTPIRMDNEADVNKATGGYATTYIELVKDGESDVL